MPFSLLEAVRSGLVGFSSWLTNRLPRLGFQGKLSEAPREVYFRISDPDGDPFEWDGEKAWLSKEGIAREKRRHELLVERASEAREARKIEVSLKELEDERRRLVRMPSSQMLEELAFNNAQAHKIVLGDRDPLLRSQGASQKTSALKPVEELLSLNATAQENVRSALARIRSSVADADSQLATLKRQDVEEGVFCGEELGGDSRVSGERGAKDRDEGLSGAGGVMSCSNPEDSRFLTEG